MMAALLPPSMLLQSKSLRWTLCATDRCFSNAAFSAFFRSVKVLPLKRGAGLQQEVIIFLANEFCCLQVCSVHSGAAQIHAVYSINLSLFIWRFSLVVRNLPCEDLAQVTDIFRALDFGVCMSIV